MEKTILYQNKKIFYQSIGEGKPVMLVHGFGEESSVWKKQVDYFQNKYHLVIPDLPGSGRSEMINDMSMEGMAEVLHAIIHEEQPPQAPPKEGLHNTQSQLNEDSKPVFKPGFSETSKVPPSGGFRGAGWTIIGHSMGGYITLALVESYWNHVTSFGLVHSSAYADSEEKKATRKKGIEFIKQHGAFEFLKTAVPNLFSPNTKEQTPGLMQDFIDSLSGFSAESLQSYYHAMMKRPDRTNLLKNSNSGVLIIAGKYDNAVPLNDSLEQCHLPEKCYFHVLKKSGHMGMIEEPSEVNRILDEFLQENEN